MRRNWLILVVLAVVGALAGFAIAGPFTSDDSIVIGSPGTGVSSTSSAAGVTAPAASVPATPDQSPTSVATTTAPTAGSSPVVQTSAAAVTVAPATTPPTAPTTTTSAADQTLARADVRLVIANGDGRFNLAGANGNRLRKAGYVSIDVVDSPSNVDATIVYYRPNFDDEAAIVAADLLIPKAILQPLPNAAITADDALGDIIVVLGPDALR